MKKLLKLLTGIVFALSMSSLSAFTVEEIVNPDVIEELKAQGVVQHRFYKSGDSSIVLAPKTPLGEETAAFWPEDAEKPVFIMENLYLLKKAELGDGDVSKMDTDLVSRIIRSVSKMEGMQYYSYSDKKVKTLYKECYCIAGPNDRTRVPDDTEGSAEGKVMYCMQNDCSFGKTNYRLEYHQQSKETSAGFINVSPVYIGFIKAVDTNNLRISLVVNDCGDSFVVYMLVQARFSALSIIENKMNDSFRGRLEAIYKWFVAQF